MGVAMNYQSRRRPIKVAETNLRRIPPRIYADECRSIQVSEVSITGIYDNCRMPHAISSLIERPASFFLFAVHNALPRNPRGKLQWESHSICQLGIHVSQAASTPSDS
ncbi:unnamed protein product [Lasius platythorax]|uniref:Uncharacterized protein n=1 Tax=Lasius platythorax TaxID=488582 RepID=A0AAV2N4Y0_9HYME